MFFLLHQGCCAGSFIQKAGLAFRPSTGVTLNGRTLNFLTIVASQGCLEMPETVQNLHTVV